MFLSLLNFPTRSWKVRVVRRRRTISAGCRSCAQPPVGPLPTSLSASASRIASSAVQRTPSPTAPTSVPPVMWNARPPAAFYVLTKVESAWAAGRSQRGPAACRRRKSVAQRPPACPRAREPNRWPPVRRPAAPAPRSRIGLAIRI